MNARHAIARRPRKDRNVTWSRSMHTGIVAWTLWRRDHRQAIHMRVVTATPLDIENCEPGRLNVKLRRAWNELRDFVDGIDLLVMEKTA